MSHQPTGSAQGDGGGGRGGVADPGPRRRERLAATHPTLRMGSPGAAVLALQRRLTTLGYWLGAADGQYGDLTRQAVVARAEGRRAGA